MKINDVAKKYKITKRSLRYYEEIGLIDSTRVGASQSRYYDNTSLNRLEQIILLRSVNFSIDQISQVLLSKDSSAAFNIFESRLVELEDKINELSYFKTVIGSFIEIGKNIGISNLNIYQLLKDQIYIQNNNERMIAMEQKYDGDIIKFEFGLAVIELIRPKDDFNFLEKIKLMRNKLEAETGKEIPLIRVRDNAELEEFQYRIMIKDKIIIKNNLINVPEAERVSEMLHYLNFVIKSNIDEILDLK
jgi:DNA-binding transcriptional MerR regulator